MFLIDFKKKFLKLEFSGRSFLFCFTAAAYDDPVLVRQFNMCSEIYNIHIDIYMYYYMK